MTKQRYLEIRNQYFRMFQMPSDEVIEKMTEEELHETCKAFVKMCDRFSKEKKNDRRTKAKTQFQKL